MRNVPLVIMETPLSQGGTASPVSATTTSTCQTWMLVTGRRESAGNAFTTQRVLAAASAKVDILGMLLDATAGVSKVPLK